MHVFLSLFLYGLLFSVAIYGTMYFISKTMDFRVRSYVLIVVGTLFLLISFLIGGFSGMPLIFLGLGIILPAILLLIFGNKKVNQRIIISMVVFLVIIIFTFFKINQTEYWIIKKNSFSGDHEINLYLETLEEEPYIKGYKIFNLEESPIIVLSLGSDMKNNNIEVLGVSEEYDKTLIKVKSFSRNYVSENPYVIIGLDKVKSNIEIIDTDGTSYEEIH